MHDIVALTRNSTEISDAVKGASGYWVGPLLTDTEVDGLRRLILAQFFERIAQLAPNAVEHFASAGMTRYHTESHRIDHARAWPRHARLMGAEGVNFIERSSLMHRLVDEFDGGTISNEIEGAAPEVVWRLVRPGQTDDIGPLHADRWFWDINRWPIPEGMRCIKLWLMVHGGLGLAGLRVAPGSHRETHWTYSVEHRHGLDKPVFDEATSGIKTNLLSTPPGTAVAFSYDLLHGGAVTGGDECRGSLEFTLFAPAA